MSGKVVELFAGVGGFRCGLNDVELTPDGKTIENGTWDFVWANQWEPSTKTQDAFNCYVKRFGESKNHTNVDISSVDKNTIPDHDLLCGGFPCLTANTLVLTDKGYKKIIDVMVGDLVLSHDSKYHKVTALLNQGQKNTYQLSSMSTKGLSLTGNHLVYVRTLEDGKLGNPEWKSVEELLEKDVNGEPLYKKYLTCSMINGNSKVLKYTGLDLSDRSFIRDIGYYLGTRVFSKEKFSFSPTYQVPILKEFFKQYFKYDGKLALPGFIINLPNNLMKFFIDGYSSSSAGKEEDFSYLMAKSKEMIYGLGQCVQKLYSVPVIITKKDDYWELKYKKKLFEYENCFYLNRSIWQPIEEIKETGLIEEVFDLTVEDSHSFTANNCTVHNCQDYSVARSLSNEKGIEGKKGVLWWQIAEILEVKRPNFVLLENVDRLLISPSKQRGRDFAIMLRTFYDLGYAVQWQVINAADYGFPQKRKRVFIFACRQDTKYFEYLDENICDVGLSEIVDKSGIFAKTFPIISSDNHYEIDLCTYSDVLCVSENYNTPFLNSGCMLRGIVYTADTKAVEKTEDDKVKLKDIIVQQPVAQNVFLSDTEIERFTYLKGSKRIPRTKPNGEPYIYTEGKMAFPDNLDVPARTMLTSEGTVNRSSHVVEDFETKRLRYLLPMEAERINCFPDNWTDTGMSLKRRYFMMGNALVVGIVKELGKEISRIVEEEYAESN